MDEDIRVKFDGQNENSEHCPKCAKLDQKGSWRAHITHFFKFYDPLISCELLKLETYLA